MLEIPAPRFAACQIAAVAARDGILGEGRK
jgi:hypothetical protein